MPGGFGGALEQATSGDLLKQIYQGLEPPNPSPMAQGAPGAPSGGAGVGGQPGQSGGALPAPSSVYSPDPMNATLLGQLVQMNQRDQYANSLNQAIGRAAASFGTKEQQEAKMRALGQDGGGGAGSSTLEAIAKSMEIQGAAQKGLEHQRFMTGADLMGQQLFGLKPGQGAWLANDPTMFEAFATNALSNQKLSDQEKLIRDWREKAKASGMSDGDIVSTETSLLGGAIGGQDPTVRAMNAASAAWDRDPTNKGQIKPSYLLDPIKYKAYAEGEVTAEEQKRKDLIADQHNFEPALQGYDEKIGLINQLSTPEMRAGMQEFLGTTGQIRPVALMSANGKKAWAIYKQLMAGQFASGTQDFKGAGRITQSELQQDAPSQSTMGQLNQSPDDFFGGMDAYRQKLIQHRAQLFGTTQRANDPRLSDEDYTKYVAPSIDMFGGPKRDVKQPAQVSTPDDVRKLPSGTPFVIPSGPHKGEIGYAP